jgi:hypothetical protein
MNRKELIEALASGNLKKIKEFKKADEEDQQGRFIGYADFNFSDEEEGNIKGNTWNIPILGLHEVNKKWVQSGKYSNLTHEEFASLIVKYDYQVMAEAFFVNHKFPEHSDAYEPPDPTMTPEKKYQKILRLLKEIAYLVKRMKGVAFRSGAEMEAWIKAEEKLMPDNL